MGKKALVLEGGSLRCMFSAGVTDRLLEQGFAFDGVFGVSAGALTGFNIVAGQPGRTAEVNLTFAPDKRYLGFRNLILHHSIFNFDFMFGEVSDTLVPLDRKAFFESPCRFTAAATNCLTGKPEYFEKGACVDIYAAVRASASMPLLAPMVSVEGKPCLDGGCSVNIPYRKAIDEGYDKILVITTREHGYRKEQVSPGLARLYGRAYPRYPALIRALMEGPRRYERELDEIDRLEAQGRLFVIRPPRPVAVSRMERDRARLQALYDEGLREAARRMDALRAYWEG